jgi:succinate dehydrogenase hydrophobic anchor subunit
MKGARGWTLHMIAGLAILFLLGLHMLTMHLGDIIRVMNPYQGEPIDWVNVAYRMKKIAMVFIYIGLLGTALYHGLFGLKNILLELPMSRTTEKVMAGIMWLVGIVMFCIGTYAAVAAYVLGKSV